MRAPTIRYCECEFPILMVLVCIHAICGVIQQFVSLSINSEFEFVV